MTDQDEAFLKKLLATFAVEADEHLQAITAGLLELENSSAIDRRKDILQTIFREAHSLKGAAGAVSRKDIVSVCQPLEGLFSALNNGSVPLTAELFDLFHQTINFIEQLLVTHKDMGDGSNPSLLESFIQRLQEGAKNEIRSKKGTEAAGAMPAFDEGPVPRKQDSRLSVSDTVRIPTFKLDRLFRQVEELIAAKLSAEQLVVDLRGAATMLKGKKSLHDKVLSYSSAFGAEQAGKASSTLLSRLTEYLHEEETATQMALDRLHALTASAAADCRALAKMVDNLLEDAKKMLMMPLSTLFEILPKIVRDLARVQGKEIDFVILGDGIDIDRRVQEQIKDPLIHIIRNCVDHGIETPDERIRKGKPGTGKITISVTQTDAGKADIIIADDGAGIDHAKLVSAAQKHDVITPEEGQQLSEQEIEDLIFRSGVSTSPILTDVSGRGLGLAIVREKIEKLNGSIRAESKINNGTTFYIKLPVTLSAVRGVVIRVGDRLFVLPTVNVERVVRISPQDIKTVENCETVYLDGRTLSLVRMADVLDIPYRTKETRANKFENVVVLISSEERIAFRVDEILHEQEILLKGLGTHLDRVRNISGSTILGSGALVPFLNVPDLMASSIKVTYTPPRGVELLPLSEQQKKSVLIAEDSITSRSLLKNILETAGYQVKTAVDGIDALTTLKTTPFDLVISDVEMPRMDGFTLTMKIRTDQKLSKLPVVLVTALDSRENRERGIDAGADAYIVKSDFDETDLLDVIRRFI